MSRIKGHALRQLAWDEEAKSFAWECECGEPLGAASVHSARASWRKHKAAIDAQDPSFIARGPAQ